MDRNMRNVTMVWMAPPRLRNKGEKKHVHGHKHTYMYDSPKSFFVVVLCNDGRIDRDINHLHFIYYTAFKQE